MLLYANFSRDTEVTSVGTTQTCKSWRRTFLDMQSASAGCVRKERRLLQDSAIFQIIDGLCRLRSVDPRLPNLFSHGKSVCQSG